ncbi:MAG: M48 family metalloprotease [Tenuifilaceae bacterium]|nr:M48 family metalloprotease [Tenuifilaceae bacterium]
MARRIFTIAVAFTLLTLSGCDDGKLNFFTLEQDIAFGMQLDSTILAEPATYPILNRAQYPEAYAHIERILNNLLQSNDLRYADRFPWEVKIINQDVLNAFAAPGGYMYFYTGLIKFLDNEAQFAGVMAHEMAHADRRHSTQMLTKQYGFSVLTSIVLGDNPTMLETIIAELAQGLGGLKYSRDNEYEADKYAVHYLYDTSYHPRSIADFFEKMEGEPNSLVFLSTHPSPEDRVEAIEKVWQSLGGKNGELYIDRYNSFKSSLP